MKHIHFIAIILLSLLSSCEEKYYVAKTFIDKTTEKPIAGLLVGLYKQGSSLSWDTAIDSIKLIGTARTDEAGRVVFEVIDNDFRFSINSHLFLPVYTSDTLSVNAKFHYKLINENYPRAGWGSNEVIEMSPYYYIQLRLTDYKGYNSLKIKYENQEYFIRNLDYTFFDIYLRPGEFNILQFYKTINNEDVFVEEKTVYVKFNDHPNRYIFDLPTTIINIKLGQ